MVQLINRGQLFLPNLTEQAIFKQSKSVRTLNPKYILLQTSNVDVVHLRREAVGMYGLCGKI